MLGFEIQHLTSRHSARSRCPRQAEQQVRAGFSVGMRHGVGKNIEGQGQQAVAGEDCGGLVERLVHRGLATAKIIVVHGGQVIVNEGIAMHQFDCSRGTKCAIHLRTYQVSGLEQ